MDRVKPATLVDVRNYFADELKVVMEKHRLSALETSTLYLASLLSRHIESHNFFAVGPNGKLADNFLTDLYIQYLQAKPEEQKLVLQRLGDVCLLVSGYFSDSLRRKVVDLSFYFGMGGSAYYNLSVMSDKTETKETFGELANKFQSFSNVLGEMSERSGLQSNKDVLRLYERWIVTGSERIRSVLNEKGITTAHKSNLKFKQ